MDDKKYIDYKSTIFILGFGSIGKAVLPLILKHIKINPEQIIICAKEAVNMHEFHDQPIKFLQYTLNKNNFNDFLAQYLTKGDFLINLSVEVCVLSLINWCQEQEVLYLDTGFESWENGFIGQDDVASLCVNYNLRKNILDYRDQSANKTTAVVTHGANPGLVSHFVKQALLNLAKDNELDFIQPKNQIEWALLAKNLGIKTIHISEKDTQTSDIIKKPNEFVNTWSVDGFISEGKLPAELSWGTHEKEIPHDANYYDENENAQIYLGKPGMLTKVNTWAPLSGAFKGFLITHAESLTIGDFLTLSNDSGIVYKPTVHFAYHPCNDAISSINELVQRNWQHPPVKRILFDEITTGVDELGVLLMGNKKGAYWFGSQLSIEEARELVPFNNATSLQVAISVLAGVIWAMQNPTKGLVEPEEIDHQFILKIALPYLGNVTGVYTDWHPQYYTNKNINSYDPWQFRNIRIIE